MLPASFITGTKTEISTFSDASVTLIYLTLFPEIGFIFNGLIRRRQSTADTWTNMTTYNLAAGILTEYLKEP
jgi:hypothetical protein